ncbi:retinitis pigmentosa 9 protein-like isoform X5 [Pan paniscus]|uniref:retinitis pigmentosa 9 protein-like isoform X5 n=1 Tax=Pan paniscus TaxID=9597 RepID=UPI001561911F|nr:retinitis pigmentosa 9 protein-like isoform X4 [Pan paniscus]
MSSWPGREDARAGGAWWPRELPDQELQRAREQKRRRHDAQQLQQLKHLESFYEKPPPGLIKAHEDFMYDIIRDNKQHEKNVSLDSKEHHFGLSSPLICDPFVQFSPKKHQSKSSALLL